MGFSYLYENLHQILLSFVIKNSKYLIMQSVVNLFMIRHNGQFKLVWISFADELSTFLNITEKVLSL